MDGEMVGGLIASCSFLTRGGLMKLIHVTQAVYFLTIGIYRAAVRYFVARRLFWQLFFVSACSRLLVVLGLCSFDR